MTWGEFKKLVEERGIVDDDKIWYIDISYPEEAGEIIVSNSKTHGVAVS